MKRNKTMIALFDNALERWKQYEEAKQGRDKEWRAYVFAQYTHFSCVIADLGLQEEFVKYGREKGAK